jgi:hypothetical protein
VPGGSPCGHPALVPGGSPCGHPALVPGGSPCGVSLLLARAAKVEHPPYTTQACIWPT